MNINPVTPRRGTTPMNPNYAPVRIQTPYIDNNQFVTAPRMPSLRRCVGGCVCEFCANCYPTPRSGQQFCDSCLAVCQSETHKKRKVLCVCEGCSCCQTPAPGREFCTKCLIDCQVDTSSSHKAKKSKG